MIYRNRPRTEYLDLYAQQSTKLLRFPDHVTRMIELNAFQWATLNWMLDGEGLDLTNDILPCVLKWSRFYHPAEHFVNESFRELLDYYLHERVQEWGPETVDLVIRRFAP